MEANSGACHCCSGTFSGARGLSGHLDQTEACRFYYSREVFHRHTSDGRGLSRTNSGPLYEGSPPGGWEEVADAFGDDEFLPPLDDRFSVDVEGDDQSLLSIAARLPGEGDDLDASDDDGAEGMAPRKQCLFTTDDEVEVLLMSLLDRMRCPRYAFDAIMEWGAYAKQQKYDMTIGRRAKRTSLIRTLCKKLKQEKMRPHTIDHRFANSTFGDIGKIVRFDFVACLMDILFDTDLMKPENLVINPDAPYTKYVSPDGLLDEVNSGRWYDRTWIELITEPHFFLLPLIFYIDKTGIDKMNQRFGLEPLKVTTSLLKRLLRNKSKAWRIIGFVYDLYHMSSAENRSREVSQLFLYKSPFRAIVP
jgi:hypothetical protein